jgi:mono/diheme cytochrome c family protein
MLCRLMRRPLLLLALPVVAAAAVACGSEEIDVAQDSPNYNGAKIFHERCAGCHSLNVVGAQGSAVDPNQREYKDGPNFDQREENYDQVLYAIRNGGFSSGPMPQDIVVGEEADAVAEFVGKYSGQSTSTPPTPNREAPEGTTQ